MGCLLLAGSLFCKHYPVLTKMKFVLFVITALLAGNQLSAQYTVNGNAARNDCHCYTLTPASFNLSGSVWNNIKIDLNQSFDFNFNIFMGCSDAGADGIVFVLQPISTSVGTTGGGLGFEGVTPSVGVTIDTWQNTPNNDPAFDHIAIQINGDINHGNPVANIAGPVTALEGNDNIEDCTWHTLRLLWDAAAKQLSAYVDGRLRVSVTKDFVADVFGGNPLVFWGFTGSTGGANNLQQFCTALSPNFTFSQGQKRCFNEPITFFDSTISFTAVQKRYWDFGDGSPVDSVNKNPVHTYTVPGKYTVTQTVIGADGCTEVNTQTVVIGGKPVVDFTYTDSCITNQVLFTDASTTPFSGITEWFWDFDNGSTANTSSFTTQFATGGDKNIRLFVKSDGGCVSDTVTKIIHVYSRPVLDFTFTDSVCLGTAVSFSGIVVNSPDPVQIFNWNFGDNNSAIPIPNPNHVFSTAGLHTVLFLATTTQNPGCLGLVTKDVFIKNKPTVFFKTNALCQGAAITLVDSSYNSEGSPVTHWWWSLGNGQFSNIQNPSVTFNTGDTAYIKLAVNDGNCFSDTLEKAMVIGQKPIVQFGYAGNVCQGEALQFTDSSIVKNGTIGQWGWIKNNALASNDKNPVLSFNAGLQSIGLSVVSDRGCKSDTLYKPITINGKPVIAMTLKNGCRNELLSFNANVNSSNIINQWNWNFGDGTTDDPVHVLHSYPDTGTYSVNLFAIDDKGCKSDTLSGNVVVYGTNAAVAANLIKASSGQPVQLHATGGINYQWFPADGLSNAFIDNPVAVNTEDKEYTVKAFTPNGCETYDTVQIKIFNGPEIYVPTAFNPLSTAGNQLLKPTAAGITRFKYFIVYNRYGQVVYSSSDPLAGWDGNVKGKPQQAGVYVWIAAGTSFRGTEIMRKGTVMLLR
jgi:PKD repeat protein